MRPWAEFADLSQFSPPNPQSSPLTERINTNASYYLANYLIVLLLPLLFSVWKHPLWMLFSLALISGVGYYVFWIHTKPFFVYYRQLSRKEVVGGYSSVATLLLLLSGGWAIILSTFIFIALIVCHAAMRQRSIKAKTGNFLQSMSALVTGAASGKHDDSLLDDDSSVDIENPASLTSGRFPGDPQAATVSADQQAAFRSQFRTSQSAQHAMQSPAAVQRMH